MIKATGNPYKLIHQLIESKETFEVRKTTKSTLIKFGEFVYMYSDNHFKNKHLNLFQRIKKEVHKNIKEQDIFPPEITRSKYFKAGQFRAIEEGEFLKFENCIEYDLNKAYYAALKKFKYISDEFYQECIGLSKDVRLALVGTLATQKTIFYYIDGVLTSYDTDKDDILRRVFFEIVEYVDKMLDYFSRLSVDNFLFYWVDGIYLKDYDRAQFHCDLMSYEFDLDFSFERIPELMVYNQGEYNTEIVLKKESGKLKRFNLNNIFVNQ